MLIAMNENKQALNEVVVVGYGAKKNKKSTTTGNVVTVKEQAKKEITPQPVIGKRSYQKYLKENLVRPTDDNCKDIKGEVVLSFFVDESHKISLLFMDYVNSLIKKPSGLSKKDLSGQVENSRQE